MGLPARVPPLCPRTNGVGASWVWLAVETRARASRDHGDTVDSDGCDLVVRRHQHQRDVQPVRESALITLVDTAIGSAARHELLTRTDMLNRALRGHASIVRLRSRRE